MKVATFYQQAAKGLRSLFFRLTTPSSNLKSPQERLLARTLAYTSLGILAAIIAPVMARVTFAPVPAPIRWFVYFAALITVVTYFLSRTRHYSIGLYVTVLTYSLGSVVIDITLPQVAHPDYILLAGWNLGAIVIAGLLLSRPQFLRVILVNLFLMSIPSLAGKVPWNWYGDLLFFFLAEAALLFGIAGATRRYTEQLAESEQRFRELFQSTLEALVIHDGVQILAVNPAFEKMFRCSEKEAIGRQPIEFVAPEARDAAWEAFIKNYDQPGTIIQSTALRCDGTRFEAEASLGIVTYKGEQVLALSLRDISRRLAAEEQLRILQRAIEQSAHSVVITNREGAIEYVNPAFTHNTGFTFEEAMGQNPRILKSGKHPPEFYKQMWEILLSGNVWRGELVNRRKNGETYWEEASIAPVRDADGQITHFVAVKEDVTKRKRLEEALRKANEELAQANQFKTQLLGNVSHDMRTPLGGIMGYTEMLLDGAFGEISEQQRHALKHILRSTQQLVDFTSDLLSQAELESGRLRLNITLFSPRELLKVVPSAEALAEAKGLKVHTEIAPNIPEKVYGDPYWLRQIIANLLSNAVKFTDEGDIWLRIYGTEDERWVIEVEDTGIGIPQEALESIFEPFRQVDGGPSRHHKGSGLGLSIVKRLVELMHGEIHVHSTPGKGSKFIAILPCQAHNEESDLA